MNRRLYEYEIKYLKRYINEYKYELDRPFLYFNLGKSRGVIYE